MCVAHLVVGQGPTQGNVRVEPRSRDLCFESAPQRPVTDDIAGERDAALTEDTARRDEVTQSLLFDQTTDAEDRSAVSPPVTTGGEASKIDAVIEPDDVRPATSAREALQIGTIEVGNGRDELGSRDLQPTCVIVHVARDVTMENVAGVRGERERHAGDI